MYPAAAFRFALDFAFGSAAALLNFGAMLKLRAEMTGGKASKSLARWDVRFSTPKHQSKQFWKISRSHSTLNSQTQVLLPMTEPLDDKNRTSTHDDVSPLQRGTTSPSTLLGFSDKMMDDLVPAAWGVSQLWCEVMVVKTLSRNRRPPLANSCKFNTPWKTGLKPKNAPNVKFTSHCKGNYVEGRKQCSTCLDSSEDLDNDMLVCQPNTYQQSEGT